MEAIPALLSGLSDISFQILRYADVAAVNVFENELTVGSHLLRFTCFGQVFHDLYAVAGDLVVKKIRLRAIDVHVVFDAEFSGILCDP